MKKKLLVLLGILFFCGLLTAEDEDTIHLEFDSFIEYDSPFLIMVSKAQGYDFYKIGVGCGNNIAIFDLLNSGFTIEEISQLIKKFRLETYDIGKYMTHDYAALALEYCLLDKLVEKYGEWKTSRLNYEFELDDIEDGYSNGYLIRSYKYSLIVQS